MKLTYFTEQTLPRQWGGVKLPRISFGKAGTITLNKPAVGLLKLAAGDKVSIAQDKEQPENWYVFLDEENGFELRGKDLDKTINLTFNHTTLKNAFLEAFGLATEDSHSFLMAGQPTVFGKKTYWGILVTTK